MDSFMLMTINLIQEIVKFIYYQPKLVHQKNFQIIGLELVILSGQMTQSIFISLQVTQNQKNKSWLKEMAMTSLALTITVLKSIFGE